MDEKGRANNKKGKAMNQQKQKMRANNKKEKSLNQQKQAEEVSEAIVNKDNKVQNRKDQNGLGKQEWGKRMKDEKILVRSYASRQAQVDDDDGNNNKSRVHPARTEFHMMNLKGNELDRCCFPSPLYCPFFGSMVVSGSCVYIMGGLDPPNDNLIQQPERLYWGGAYLDLDSSLLGGHGWNQVPVPNVDRRVPFCAALKGKMYSFGFNRPTPEVYDPAVGDWTLFSSAPLPCHLARSRVLSPVLPDSANHRILLQLSGGDLVEPSLFAFYPDESSGSHWKCVATGFRQWYHVATVADDVLYIHNRKKYRSLILGAYDLVKGIWLDVEWTSPFEDNVDRRVAHREFYAVFPFGPQTLCMALWTTVDILFPGVSSSDDVRVFFLKVQVERTGSTIRLSPLSSHTFNLPNTISVLDFIPV